MTTGITTVPPRPTAALLEVEGTFEMEDYLAQQIHLRERGDPRWRRRFAGALFFLTALHFVVPAAVLTGLVFRWFVSGRPFTMEFPVLVGITLASLLLMGRGIRYVWDETSPEGMRRQYRWCARWKARVLGWLGHLHLGCRQRLALSPEELIHVVEHDQWLGVRMRARFEYRMPWEVIQAVEVNEEDLFVILDKKQAFSIPARWFPDQASFDDYGRTAWEYWVGATRAPEGLR